MAQPPATQAAPVIEKALPYWRWLDDDYIAHGKVSKTAIVEIFLAIGFYYLVARYSTFPLVTVFTFLAVPLLLLRSEASIERGVELLEQSWNKEIRNRAKKKWLVVGLSFVICSALSYWVADYLAHNWLVGHSGLFFWSSVYVGIVSIAIAFTGLGVVIALTNADNVFKNGVVNVNLVETYTGSGAGAFSVIGGSCATAILAVAKISTDLLSMVEIVMSTALGVGIIVIVIPTVGNGTILFSAGYLFGLFLHSVCIRVWATFTNLSEGFKAFSGNWVEILLVSDFRHAPALIPRAAKVSKHLNVATMPSGDGTRVDWVVKSALKTIMFVAATLYRWNIKASCWIWWPLALLMAEVKWPRDPALAANKAPDVRRTTTQFWSSEYFIAALLACTSAVFVYLLYRDISGDWTKKIPDWLRNLIILIPTNTQNIRYWLIALFFVALLTMFICMLKARTHAETLQNHEVHQNLPQNADPSIDKNFDKTAKWLVKARLFIFGSFLLFVYALGLRYAIDKWPDHVGGVVFSWLKDML